MRQFELLANCELQSEKEKDALAIVSKLEKLTLDRDTNHTDVKCTYSIVTDEDGHNCLQIDTYGSTKRQIPGKKSQTIRFTREALVQLRAILDTEV
jgi:hypothetical protein